MQNMGPPPVPKRIINNFDSTVHGAPLLVPRNVRTLRERIRRIAGPSDWDTYDNYFVRICCDAPNADLDVAPMQRFVERLHSIISDHNILAVMINPQLRGVPRLPIINSPKDSDQEGGATHVAIPDDEKLPKAPEPYTWHPPSNWNDPGCTPHWSAPDMHEDYY